MGYTNDQRKHLGILGLDPHGDYTLPELKKVWRECCHKYHPDKPDGDETKFIAVMHAYKMLTDPEYIHSNNVRKEGAKGSLDIRMTIPITFDDAFFGREVMFSFNTVELDEDKTPVTGKQFDVYALKVKVPAGAFAHQHVAKGKGMQLGDSRGDAFITFLATSHKKFTMEEDDRGRQYITSKESIPLDVMLAGGEIECLTMYGMKTVKVPPGSKDGDFISIPDCGINNKGDHKVYLSPIYPTKEDLKSKKLWKGLNIKWEEEETSKEGDQDEENMRAFERFMQSGFRSKGDDEETL